MPLLGLGYGTVLQGRQTVADVLYELEAIQRDGDHDGESQPVYTALLTLQRGSLIIKLAEDHLTLVTDDGRRFRVLPGYEIDYVGRYRVQLTPAATPTHDY